MKRVTLVRYTVKPGRDEENEALVRAVFEELRAAAPPQVTYQVFRNGREFVHLFVNLAGEDADALTELAAFQAHVADIRARCETPPAQTRLQVELLQSYGVAAATA